MIYDFSPHEGAVTIEGDLDNRPWYSARPNPFIRPHIVTALADGEVIPAHYIRLEGSDLVVAEDGRRLDGIAANRHIAKLAKLVMAHAKRCESCGGPSLTLHAGMCEGCLARTNPKTRIVQSSEITPQRGLNANAYVNIEPDADHLTRWILGLRHTDFTETARDEAIRAWMLATSFPAMTGEQICKIVGGAK